MLIIIFRKFFIMLLCWSILSLNISISKNDLHIQYNSAYAGQTVTTGGIEDGGMIASLEMVGIGLVASRLWKYGKLTPDMMVAAAAGGAFVAGEVLAYLKLKDIKNKIETSIESGKKDNNYDEQRQSLIRLIQMYEAAKDSATTKKNLQLASAAAFTAAGVMSYMSAMADDGVVFKCQAAFMSLIPAAVSTVTSTCSGLAAACSSSPGSPVCFEAAACSEELGACTPTIPLSVSAFNAYLAQRTLPTPTLTGVPAVNSTRSAWIAARAVTTGACLAHSKPIAAAMAVCLDVEPIHMINESGPSAPITVLVNSNKNLQNLYLEEKNNILNLKKFKLLDFFKNNLFIPSARADLFSPMGIASSAAVGLLMTFSSSLAYTVDLNILIPKRRAIIWGVMAAGAFAASSATGNAIEQIQTDIDKLNALLNTINMQANGNDIANAIKKQNPSVNKDLLTNSAITINRSQNEIDISEGGQYKLPCLTGDGKNGKCESMSTQLTKSEFISSVPQGLRADILNIGKMADGLSNTSKISSSTLANVKSLAGNANAIKNEYNKQKELFQKIAKDNKDNFDSEKETKNFEKGLNTSLEEALKKNNLKLSDAYASLGSNLPSNNSKTNVVPTSTKSAGINKNSVSTPFPQVNIKKPIDMKLDENKSNNIETTDLKNNTSIDDYEIKNDITLDKKANIFEVITIRYQKSGYPRLFKRINE